MKKHIIFLMIVVLLTVSTGVTFGNGFYEDGGLVGLVANGAGHLVKDPIGALCGAGGAIANTVVAGGKGVCTGGATCVGLVASGAGHLSKDPVGALSTAGKAIVDTTAAGGKGVYTGGATCVGLVASGSKHLAKDPVGALGTAGKAVADTAWKGVVAVCRVAVGGK